MSARKIISRVVIFALAPATAVAGILLFSDRQYYLISMVMVIYSLLPFFMRFERRRPQAREVIIIAVMVAIAVAGRAAFFMTPNFKPVGAIVIITGICFGGEAGFLTGAMAAFVSNFFFGQGPWTPWQMLAFGLMGLLAGALFAPGRLPRKIPLICVYGGLSTYLIYAVIVNVSSLFIFLGEYSWQALLAGFVTALGFDITHVCATVIFLALLSGEFIKKLTRLQEKFGMLR